MRSEKQNVTLALPKRLVRRAKVVAAERETSISAIIAELLAGFVDQHDPSSQTRKRAVADMKRGLGYSVGSARWKRADLHDR